MVLTCLMAIIIVAAAITLVGLAFTAATSFILLFGDLIIFAGVCYGVYWLVKWILKK